MRWLAALVAVFILVALSVLVLAIWAGVFAIAGSVVFGPDFIDYWSG